MDSKRKANGSVERDYDDRSKRRKTDPQSFDLGKGESRESTSAYGLAFLESIRRTADKSGRRVAGHFEKLVPRKGNEAYYRETRMPISLGRIERKLRNGDFKNLTELESYFKRMVQNAKEFYHRSSTTFEDAERVRKAVSNYMVKTNPAYQRRGYQATNTPLPPEGVDISDDEDDYDATAENGGGAIEEDNEDEEEEEQDEEEDEEEEEEPESNSRRIVLKRPGRASRTSTGPVVDSPRRSGPPDHHFEDVPYKGLTLQQAQEKLIEEMIRHMEPEFDNAYFDPFINLPPRSLKDYYKMIQDPISLKKLQKHVKGVQGRHETTGVSEYKTWAQFEEKAKLLWENAYYFNEENSDIYNLAQELERFFYKQYKEAAAAVPDPAQPKIKLKVGAPAEPVGSSKKITLHVGGRAGEAESPAPQPVPAPSSAPKQEIKAVPTPVQMPVFAPLEKTRSVSIASPSPSIQLSVARDASPAGMMRPSTGSSHHLTPGYARPAVPYMPMQPQLAPPPVPQALPTEQRRFRAAGKGITDALISGIQIQAYAANSEQPLVFSIAPDAKDMQTSVAVNLPSIYQRMTITVKLPDFLAERQHSLWTMFDRQSLRPSQHSMPNQHMAERSFDVLLRQGLNTTEAHLVAAIPRSERVPGGPEIELEVFTILVNVLKG